MRCFIFYGEGEVVDVSLPEAVALADAKSGFEEDDVSVKAWRPKKVELNANIPHQGSYLSVNGHTIDAGQKGVDLREWVETKAVMYLDILPSEGRMPPRCETPHVGGSY